ncbi:ABC transporter ATP-binding protein [Planobispora takensis]|uniref:Multidrug ABC transporter ATP-binding protein n=1 Tax=Planobispora takensis TaxID=1367882 RepID=A0A8J3SVZ4_9ACTN|nr:ABC transporter ATP-binding protein [Planobispora takensis]GII01649.1 multidrug ABC transporter ATP-binding protein [Planobispora takensis]
MHDRPLSEQEASPAPGIRSRVARLFVPYRAAVCVIAVLIMIYSALNAAVPLLTQVVFDRALFGPGGPDLPLLALAAGLAAALACAVGAVDLGQTWVSSRVAQRVVHTLRVEMFGRLQRMPLTFFAAERGGEVQSRLAGDTAQIEYAIKDTLPGLLSGVFGFVAAAGAMVVLSPELAGVALVLSPVVLLVASRSGRALERLSAAAQRVRAELSSIAAERLALGGVVLARVHGRREDEIAGFAAESERLTRLGVRSGVVAQVVMSAGHVFFVLTPYLVFLVAGLTDGVTPGTLAAFAVLQARIHQPLWQVLNVSTEIRSALGAFARVFDYLDLRPAPEPPPSLGPAALAAPGSGALTVRGAGFRHPGTDRRERPALREVSFDVPAASATLIVGPSGSGKTTLGHLLAGLHPPAGGSIELDGTEVRGPLPGRVCIVAQEPFLFQASVADNLRYAAPEAPDDELARVCGIARIHDRIMELPGGYGAPVGERGALLSGGERQRVALARALLAGTPVLVLDEATSALDPLTEREVVEAVLAERKGRTTVMITHRFGVTESFDTVVALERGRVVEQGARADLLRDRDGLYARMVRAQTGGSGETGSGDTGDGASG